MLGELSSGIPTGNGEIFGGHGRVLHPRKRKHGSWKRPPWKRNIYLQKPWIFGYQPLVLGGCMSFGIVVFLWSFAFCPPGEVGCIANKKGWKHRENLPHLERKDAWDWTKTLGPRLFWNMFFLPPEVNLDAMTKENLEREKHKHQILGRWFQMLLKLFIPTWGDVPIWLVHIFSKFGNSTTN